jgi:hypothetical protein
MLSGEEHQGVGKAARQPEIVNGDERGCTALSSDPAHEVQRTLQRSACATLLEFAFDLFMPWPAKPALVSNGGRPQMRLQRHAEAVGRVCRYF